MAELSNQEIGLVDELRKRMDSLFTEEEQRKDWFLIRWIRARNGDLDAAEKMLTESLRWREEHGLNTILKQNFPSTLHQLAPYHILGTDREGRPVVEIPFGKWDIKKILSTVGETEFFNYTNQFLESIVQKIQSRIGKDDEDQNNNGMKFTQATFLVNMEGYSYSQLANIGSVRNTLQLAGRYEAYYPEIIAVFLIINAPTIFSILFALVKPLLAPNTMAKISILGGNYSSWGPIVDGFVAQDQIGPEYGGTANRSLP